jgi:hypothetical protein
MIDEQKRQWLEIAVKEIRGKLMKMKVHDSYALINSVSGEIQAVSGGDKHKASLLYNYYGIFPDMGVGKGVPKDEVALQKMLEGGSRHSGRRRKPWTREVAHQAHRFGDMIQKHYSDAMVENIAKDIRKKISFDF